MRACLRSLGRSPGFSAVVIGVLGLGMGANAALFSIIDRVLLHPFPYQDAERLVDISGRDAKGFPTGVSPAAFKFWNGRVTAFQQSAIWHWRDLMLTGVEDPESIWGLEVSPQTFDILGVRPLYGRLFHAKDYGSDSQPVAILSYTFWQRHFRGDPALVGRQILLDRQGYIVAGIMGPEFMFSRPDFKVWIPLNPFRMVREELAHAYSGMARLRPGFTVQQAQHEMDALMPSVPKSPGEEPGWHALVRPYAEEYVGEYRQQLYILWGAVLFVLLIACANAANLLLARASNRKREFAVRASLGAGRLRLARQILAESMVLGTSAGAVGILLALLVLRALLLAFPDPVAFIRPDKTSLTSSALAVTLATVLATTILCSLPSCWNLWRSNLNTTLQASSRGSSGDRASNRARSMLVALEFALSLTLLIGAGVMLQSLYRLLHVPLGFNPDHVLTARVAAPPQLKKREQLTPYFDRVLEQVNTIPGSRSSGIVTVLPLGNLVATTSLSVQGQPAPTVESRRSYPVRLRSVSPGYFKAMGVRMLRGRTFDEHDASKSSAVAIVNDELARHYWPDQDPIGKGVSREQNPQPGDWLTVVGVIESARDGLRANPAAELYLPYTQDMTAARATSVVVRTEGDPLSIASILRKRIHALNPEQPVTEVKTMKAWVKQAAAQPRFNTALLEIFAGLALVLALSGVFAAVSYTVTQRTHEIGVRGALGATRSDIASFVVRLAMRPVLAGSCLGLAGALAATRALRSQLFETTPLDPTVLATAVPLLLAAALLAALVPARRASRVDPAITLRSE